MKTPAIVPSVMLVFTAGCSTPPPMEEEPPEPYDLQDYVMSFPTPAKPTPKHPWENGYRPPEEVEIERAMSREPASFVMSDEAVRNALFHLRYPATEAARERARRDDAMREMERQREADDRRRRDAEENKKKRAK